MPAAQSFIRYGVEWPATFTDLQVEFYCIKKGGKWTEDGDQFGAGLYEHYRQAEKLLWPEDDEHRWSKLALETMVNNEVSVFCGCSDSNKTYSMSKFVLTDWWAFPDNTLWLISSTELRGAELRVWGTLKQLFNRARKIHPDLPGSVLESRHAITTEEISDDNKKARLLTKGLIFIPCKTNGKWVGLGCFPAGSLVDTPSGPRKIEDIEQWDYVLNCAGCARVRRTSVRKAKQLVRVTLADGRTLDCTPEHPIFTDTGWQHAIDIGSQSVVFSADEAMQIMQVVPESIFTEGQSCGFLQSILQRELEVGATRNSREVQEQSRRSGSRKSKGKRKYLGQSSGAKAAKRENAKANQGWQAGQVEIMEGNRFWYDSKGRVRNALPVSKSKTQLPNPDWVVFKAREPSAVLAGFRLARHKTERGSGRSVPQSTGAKKKGRSANQIPFGTRVVGVEVLKSVGAPRSGKGKGSYQVYNLEVEGHPSYSVNGVLIHNSYQGIKGGSLNARLGHFGDEVQSMFPSFLDAYSNWYGKQNFKGIMAGNPNDLEDCLCIAAEPVDGWANWKDTQKTQTWRSRFYDAAVVSFDGRDSPNMDVPETEKAPFPYLIGRKKLKAVEKTHGKDSWQYASQCTGKPRPGAMANRVITRQLCEEHNAFEDVIWSGKPLIRIAACDAAYGGIGGDDCIMGHIEFGEDVDGRTILACNPPVLVPVSVTKKGLPEEQIANFVKDYCLSFDIPPENFFFDARSTMAITFARIWSPSVNVVDFGGAATSRPVSMDTFIWDGDTQTRRLQMCNELYSKFVTELWYSIYYIIVGNQMARLPREVADEGCKREWKLVRGNRIEIETKADMKLRTGRSPDRFDWLVTAVEGARRRGFEMMSMASVATEEGNDFWLEHALEKHNKWAKRHELKYA